MSFSPPARIAFREARRNPWRSALVMAMVALPIAALAGGAVAISTIIPSPAELVAERMGSADLTLDTWPRDLDRTSLLQLLPAGSRVVTRRSDYIQDVIHGSIVYIGLHEFSVPMDEDPVRGMFTLTAGRAPTAAGEVALHPHVLTAMHARIGDRVFFKDAGLHLTVTGMVVAPDQVSDPVGVLGPGTLEGLPGTATDGFFITVPRASLGAAERGLAGTGSIGFTTQEEVARIDGPAVLVATGASFAGAVVVLFAMGLVAAAAFAVGARRQLRTLGLVGAAGGDPRQVRGVVLWGGSILGLLGSLLGVALGVAGAAAIDPSLSGLAGREVGPISVPVAALAGAVLLGTLAGTLAAYGPARMAGRLSTTDALAGRMPAGRPPGKLALAGGFILVAGAGLTAIGTRRDGSAMLAVGLLAMGSGCLLAIPILITWLGRAARLLPTTVRLAARDTARNGRRTGAALAAATIALAVPVAISALTLSNEAGERTVPFMAADHLVVNDDGPDQHRQERERSLVHELDQALPGSIMVWLAPARFSVDPTAPDREGVDMNGIVDGPTITPQQGVSYVARGPLYIGGPAMLRAFHAGDGIPALEAGKVVAIGPGGTDHGFVHVHRPLGANGIDSTVALPAVEAGSSRYASIGSNEWTFVISLAAASHLGLEPTPVSGSSVMLLRAPHDLTGQEIERAKDIVARHIGAYAISARDLGSHDGPDRLWAIASGALLGLAILAVALALVRSESRRDQAILVAVGAEPRDRRRIAAAGALLLAFLGGALAVPVGFLPIAVIQSALTGDTPIVVPWGAIAAVLFAVPLLAGTVSAVTSRQPPVLDLLQPRT